MEEYIFDGEPHAIDSKLAYILKKVDPSEKEFDMEQEFMDMYRKYAEYLYESDKEKVIQYLMKIFNHYVTFDESVPDTTRIYRPPHMSNALSQYATMALKFNRSEKDTLVTP